ncbi:MAG: hypothetical protein C0401_03815 [Anaerolinea sp.]|nr:hypothetical protein [Anaerolinea sp.]
MKTLLIQLFITLLLAHLISDFLLQTSILIKNKKKLPWMIFHSLIHGIAAYALLASWTEWRAPAIIALSHFLIDLVKTRLKRDNLAAFLLDQGLHLMVIILLIVVFLFPESITPYWFTILPASALSVALVLTALLLLIPTGGIMIGYFVMPFQKQISEHYKKIKKEPVEGLKDGGKVIGWLERALIFLFVLGGQFAGIGFLVAAKTVFRFGEFKESENRKEAEYIIIGTFASFFYAILISILAKWALGWSSN